MSSEKGTIRIAYKVDDADLVKLDDGQARVEAVGQAAANTSPQIEALAAAMRAAKAAAKEEASALGLTVTEYKKIQREAAIAGQVEVKRSQDASRAAATAAAAVASSSKTAAAATEKSAAAASRGLVGIGQQLSDVASQLATGTNPFTIFIQQGPQIAGVAAEAGFGLAVLAKGAAVAAAAVASLAIIGVTLYGALSPLVDAAGRVAAAIYGMETEPVTEAMEAQRRAATLLAQSYEALGPLLDDTRDKQRELAVLTGQLTEEQGKLQKSAETAFKGYQDAIETTRAKLSELKRAQAGVTTQIVDGAESIIPAWTPLGVALRGLTSSSEDYREEIYAGEAAMQTAMVTLGENVQVNQEVIKKTEAAKKAEKDRKDGLKDSNRAMKDYARDLEEITRALEKFADVQRKAEAATRITVTELEGVGTTGAGKVYADLAVDIQKLTEKQAEVVAGLEEEQKKALESAHTHEERAKIVFAALDAITAVETQYAQERITASEQAEAEITAILLEEEEARAEAAEKALKLREDLAKKQADILEKAADDARKAAEAERALVNQSLQAAQQVAAAIGDVFAQQQAKAEEALSATRSELDQIAGLLEGLSTATVDAASLSGQALIDAYASGQVAAEDLSDTQRAAVESQLKAEQKAAEAREQAQKDAALAAWDAQHSTAVAMALINIPLAISQALASAPYPANLVFAGISGALAAAAAVAVAAEKPPSFRAGYMPDQKLAMYEPASEMFVPASGVQAMGGRESAQKAFAGVAPSGGGMTQKTVFMLGHREFSAMARNSADRPGVFRDLTRKPSTGSKRPYG